MFRVICCAVGVLFAGSVLPAAAQHARLSGRVVDAESKQALPGANVVLTAADGNERGTAADEDGLFLFSGLLPGSYVLTVSLVGFEEHSDSLVLSLGEQQHRVISLLETTTALDQVTIQEEGTPEELEGVGIDIIPPDELARVPAPGLSADLSNYLTTLPGVVTRSDQGGQLFIRGGTPTQNLVLVDGVPVFQPFHLIGFYSAFPADIISHVNMYAGGFGAQHGGRIASVIDVHTDTGNKQRVEGAASIAPFLSSIQLNIPFVPNKVSIMGSVRESVIEQVSPALLGDSLPYHFGDQFARFHAFLNSISTLSVSFLHSFDEGQLGGVDENPKQIERDNIAVGAHYSFLPPTSAVRFEARTYYTAFRNTHSSFFASERYSNVTGFGGEMVFSYLMDPVDLSAGIFAKTNKFNYDIGDGEQNTHTTEGGLYLRALYDPVRTFSIEPGLRLHTYTSSGDITIAPRLRIAWEPIAGHRFTAAGGLYHQQIIGLYNLRDISDIFIAWRPSIRFQAVPSAVHYLGGWTGQILSGLELEVEAYHKQMRNLTFFAYNDLTGSTLQIARTDGRASGLDLRMRGSRGPFTFSAGYGLAEVVYERPGFSQVGGLSPPDLIPWRPDPSQPDRSSGFHPPHDRRHQLDAMISFSSASYTVSARWQYGSGLPYTQARGIYSVVPVLNPNDNFHTRPGNLAISFDEAFAARLPAYHRMDVSAARTFTFDAFQLVVQASVINAYDRANILDYNLVTGQRSNQLPLIPSLGIKASF